MKQQPIKKRPLTQAEAGMAKSLTQMKKPMTAKENAQANKDYKKLVQEDRKLNPVKGRGLYGTDMTKVPSAAKKLMELKAKKK